MQLSSHTFFTTKPFPTSAEPWSGVENGRNRREYLKVAIHPAILAELNGLQKIVTGYIHVCTVPLHISHTAQDMKEIIIQNAAFYILMVGGDKFQ